MILRCFAPPATKSITTPKSKSTSKSITCTTLINSRFQTLWIRLMLMNKSRNHWQISPGSFIPWSNRNNFSARNSMKSITWTSTSCITRKWTRKKAMSR
jgi:hypothetical protein